MYDDPADIRKHLVAVRVNDTNRERLQEKARAYRMQPSTFAHDVLVAVLQADDQTSAQLTGLLGL